MEPKPVDALIVDDKEQNIEDNDRTIDGIPAKIVFLRAI